MLRSHATMHKPRGEVEEELNGARAVLYEEQSTLGDACDEARRAIAAAETRTALPYGVDRAWVDATLERLDKEIGELQSLPEDRIQRFRYWGGMLGALDELDALRATLAARAARLAELDAEIAAISRTYEMIAGKQTGAA
jgi:hypothetical protein